MRWLNPLACRGRRGSPPRHRGGLGPLQSSLLLLCLGLSGGLLTPVLAQPEVHQRSGYKALKSDPVAISSPRFSLSEGTYLYAQVQQPDQIQQEYFVFQVRQNRVVGAFYMPFSSYDCFYGTLDGNVIDLIIIGSYDRQQYSHSVSLRDYFSLKDLSDTDQAILDACRADHSKTAFE